MTLNLVEAVLVETADCRIVVEEEGAAVVVETRWNSGRWGARKRFARAHFEALRRAMTELAEQEAQPAGNITIAISSPTTGWQYPIRGSALRELPPL